MRRARPATAGCLCRRAGAWWVRYRADVADPDTGELHRRTLSLRLGSTAELRTEAAARSAADALLAGLYPDSLQRGRSMRVGEWCERWLVTHAATRRDGTARLYRTIVRRHIASHLAHLDLRLLDAPRAQELVARWSAAGASPASIRTRRTILLALVRAARRARMAAHRIDARDVPLPTVRRLVKPRPVIDDDSLTRLLGAARPPWRALFATMGYAGLRVSEALGLAWSDVDLAAGELHVRAQWNGRELAPTKSKASAAVIPLLSPLRAELTALRHSQGCPAEGFLFANPRTGKPYSADQARHALRTLQARLRLPPSGCHAFRHGVPARLLAAGLDVSHVQRLMRHETLAQTARYTHSSANELRAQLRRAGLMEEQA